MLANRFARVSMRLGALAVKQEQAAFVGWSQKSLTAQRGWIKALDAVRWNSSSSDRVVKEMDFVSCDLKVEDVTNGKVLADTTAEGSQGPVTFTVGQGQVVPGLEKRMVGMKVGDSWSEVLGPEDAFGFRTPEKVVKIPLPKDPNTGQVSVENLEVGKRVQLTDGQVGTILSLGDETAEIDLNHVYADKEVKMSVTLLDISDGDDKFSSVQVQTLTPGDGQTYPQPGDQVAVHYVGMLASNGKVFDQSSSPIRFQLGTGTVIQGWDIGIARLSLGEQARLFIASEFAYGARGAGGAIPPNANLIFDVQLVEINGKQVDK